MKKTPNRNWDMRDWKGVIVKRVPSVQEINTNRKQPGKPPELRTNEEDITKTLLMGGVEGVGGGTTLQKAGNRRVEP